MAHLAVAIRIANAATVNEDGLPDHAALGALLRQAASRIEAGRTQASLIDDNGNTVGQVIITPDLPDGD